MPDGMSDDLRAGMQGADVAAPGAPMAPPAGSPDSNEVARRGKIEQAKASVNMAMSLLDTALAGLGSDSEEGAVVIKALSVLSKRFAGEKAKDLVPAEILQMISGQSDEDKKQAAAELGAGAPGMTPGGVMTGPHVPANINP